MLNDLDDFVSTGLEEKFQKAADYLAKISTNVSSDKLLEFYGLYKQSTCGKCNTPKPGFFNAQAKSKWSAWNKLGDMRSSDAMEMYVEKLNDYHPDWDQADKSSTKKTFWASVSIQQPEPEATVPECEKTIFDYVKERNFTKFKEICKIDSSLNELDDTGLGLIHWATDRNAVDILKFVLENGADVNLQDSDGQTALHFASSCGHIDCLKLLIEFGADRNRVDNDGATCLDVAFDSSVQEIFNN